MPARCNGSSKFTSRRSILCKAVPVTDTKPAGSKLPPPPEWLPEQGVTALEFLNSTTFDIKETALYQNRLKPYLDNETFTKSTGWKELPESINGRAAMLGFVAGALAEIFGAGPLLLQFSKSPQPVLIVLALIIVGSVVPIVKVGQLPEGSKGDYLDSLKDTYSVPEGVFTEPLERVHGRLAMLGVGGLVLLELLKGSAVL